MVPGEFFKRMQSNLPEGQSSFLPPSILSRSLFQSTDPIDGVSINKCQNDLEDWMHPGKDIQDILVTALSVLEESTNVVRPATSLTQAEKQNSDFTDIPRKKEQKAQYQKHIN